LVGTLAERGVKVVISFEEPRWKVVVKDVRCVAETYVSDYQVRLGYATGWWRLFFKPGKALYDAVRRALAVWERTTGERIQG